MKQPLKENSHTFSSYSFAAYCNEAADEKRKKYFSENFDLESERLDVFGPHNKCDGPCAGTGWLPVSKSDMENPYRHLWLQAELDTPSEDGFHLVPCPKCSPIQTGLDEHIVKQGSEFVLKSKKSNKDLGKYPSKKGAEKREKQVEYFKGLKEDAVLPGSGARKADKEGVPQRATKEPGGDPQARKERKSKKLLPYEFSNQHDAESSSGHLGLTGSHTTGGGIYKPGTSDLALRNAVAAKKQKQQQKGHRFQEETDETMDKANLPEANKKAHKVWSESSKFPDTKQAVSRIRDVVHSVLKNEDE